MSARIAAWKRRIRRGALIFSRARVNQRCRVTGMSGDLLVRDQAVHLVRCTVSSGTDASTEAGLSSTLGWSFPRRKTRL
jgi:hypothetical protein